MDRVQKGKFKHCFELNVAKHPSRDLLLFFSSVLISPHNFSPVHFYPRDIHPSLQRSFIIKQKHSILQGHTKLKAHHHPPRSLLSSTMESSKVLVLINSQMHWCH